MLTLWMVFPAGIHAQESAVPGTAGSEGSVLADQVLDLADERLSGGERFEALISKIKEQQAQLSSLEARFVQTKKSILLLEPEVSRGTFSYQAPDLARWEFTEPNEIVMVISDGEMVTWYRDLGTAERLPVDKHTAQIEQYLAATNSVERLRRYFDFTAAFPTDGRPYRVELSPRFTRVAKRIKGMTIWFDRQSFVPVRLTYEEPDGDTTEFVFEHVEINPTLPGERFRIDLPPNVRVNTLGAKGS
jgi:outer membrane lipoprotein-sorting protein